jgi:hypothetical protein
LLVKLTKGKGGKMPNWCGNSLYVYGPEEDVRAFAKGILSVTMDNRQVVKEVSLCKSYAPLSSGDWDYDVANEEWGSKWGDCETYVGEVSAYGDGEAAVDVSYQTAWGPNNEALYTISKRWPTLTFESAYEEPGMMFRGNFNVKNGEILFQDEGELPTPEIPGKDRFTEDEIDQIWTWYWDSFEYDWDACQEIMDDVVKDFIEEHRQDLLVH